MKEKVSILENKNNTLSNDKVILENKVKDLSTNISKFNKGKDILAHLISISKPPYNKDGLGFKRTSEPQPRYAGLYTKCKKIHE